MKDMTRFVLIFILAFSAALFIAYYMERLAVPIFQELLSAFIFISIITGTISYALYAYVDGISKDVSADDNNSGRGNYISVVNRLNELKKEILINAFSVVGLLVVEKIAHGVSLIVPVSDEEPFNWVWACSISVRVACFALSVVVAAIQFHGFLIASDYRAIISRSK